MLTAVDGDVYSMLTAVDGDVYSVLTAVSTSHFTTAAYRIKSLTKEAA